MTAFDISGDVAGEIADRIFVIFNPNETETTVELPEGKWDVCVAGKKAGVTAIRSVDNGKIAVEPISAMVLIQGKLAPDGYISADGGAGSQTGNTENAGNTNAGETRNTGDGSAASDSSENSAKEESSGKSFGIGSVILAAVIGLLAGFGGSFLIWRKKR